MDVVDLDPNILTWGLLLVAAVAVFARVRVAFDRSREEKRPFEDVVVRVVRRVRTPAAPAGISPAMAVPFAANAAGPDPEDAVRRMARTLLALADKRDPVGAAQARRAAARITTLAASRGIGGEDVERAALAGMLLKLGPGVLPASLQPKPERAFSSVLMETAHLEGPVPAIVKAIRDGSPVEKRLEPLVALVREAA
ncbi:MAG: hypothetical protein ING44_10110 [Telmatospirillum sp.]|nr:hypothetical protein [Telmatospirillum sp.]